MILELILAFGSLVIALIAAAMLTQAVVTFDVRHRGMEDFFRWLAIAMQFLLVPYAVYVLLRTNLLGDSCVLLTGAFYLSVVLMAAFMFQVALSVEGISKHVFFLMSGALVVFIILLIIAPSVISFDLASVVGDCATWVNYFIYASVIAVAVVVIKAAQYLTSVSRKGSKDY